MPSKVILMMPKNLELSKFQRFKNQVLKNQESRFKIQDSRIKFQESRFKDNQDQNLRHKIQESREDSIKISTKKVFQNIE